MQISKISVYVMKCSKGFGAFCNSRSKCLV